MKKVYLFCIFKYKTTTEWISRNGTVVYFNQISQWEEPENQEKCFSLLLESNVKLPRQQEPVGPKPWEKENTGTKPDTWCHFSSVESVMW